MKRLSRYGLILFTGMALATTPLQAQAMTTTELDTLISEKGLDVAVESALAAGMKLSDILATSMSTENNNSQTILVSMCSAGANGADLRAAAMSMDISPLIFASAMETCASQGDGDEVQAYTPVEARVTARARVVGVDTPPEPYASPSVF